LRATRRLAQLSCDLQAATQEPLFLAYGVILEAHAALHQELQRLQELPHHPFGERRLERLNVRGRSLAPPDIKAPFQHPPQRAPRRRGIDRVIEALR
jgi:hypothetical protein